MTIIGSRTNFFQAEKYEIRPAGRQPRRKVPVGTMYATIRDNGGPDELRILELIQSLYWRKEITGAERVARITALYKRVQTQGVFQTLAEKMRNN